MVVSKDLSNEFGDFYKFETITLAPIDTKPIIKTLLSTEELQWFNAYHSKVYEVLSQGLNEKEKVFLQELTQAI